MAKSSKFEVVDEDSRPTKVAKEAPKTAKKPNGVSADALRKPFVEMTKDELKAAQSAVGNLIATNQRLQAMYQQTVNNAQAALADKSADIDIRFGELCVKIVENATTFEAYDHSEIVSDAINTIKMIVEPKNKESDGQEGSDGESE